MIYESRVCWEKLSVELELLNIEDPNSLLPILAGYDAVLYPEEARENTLRNINFLSFGLASKCEGYCEADRFHILNDFFFEQKGFQFLGYKINQLSAPEYALSSVINTRNGAPLTLALIYTHLASHIDIPAYLVHMNLRCILKWVRGGKSSFIDLSSGGRLLTERELLIAINKNNEIPDEDNNYFDILPNRKVLSRYFRDLVKIFERDKNTSHLLKTYDVLLKIEPSNIHILGQRALLKQRAGFLKEALADLKRYFSFVEKDQAPTEIRMAYFELTTIQESGHSPKIELLH